MGVIPPESHFREGQVDRVYRMPSGKVDFNKAREMAREALGLEA